MKRSTLFSSFVYCFGVAFQQHTTNGFVVDSSVTKSCRRRSFELFDQPVPFYLWDGATTQEKAIAREIFQKTLEFQHHEDDEEEEEDWHESHHFSEEIQRLEQASVPFYLLNDEESSKHQSTDEMSHHQVLLQNEHRQDSSSSLTNLNGERANGHNENTIKKDEIPSTHSIQEEFSSEYNDEGKNEKELEEDTFSSSEVPMLHGLPIRENGQVSMSTIDDAHIQINKKKREKSKYGSTDKLVAMATNREITAEQLEAMAKEEEEEEEEEGFETAQQQVPRLRPDDFQKTDIFLRALGDAAKDGASSAIQEMGRGLRWNAAVTVAKTLPEEEKVKLIGILQESLTEHKLPANSAEKEQQVLMEQESLMLKDVLEERTRENQGLLVRESELTLQLEQDQMNRKSGIDGRSTPSFEAEELLIASEYLAQWELHLNAHKYANDKHYIFDI